MLTFDLNFNFFFSSVSFYLSSEPYQEHSLKVLFDIPHNDQSFLSLDALLVKGVGSKTTKKIIKPFGTNVP